MLTPETKKRLIDILLTACVGAGIAFLQSLLSGLVGLNVPDINPEVAAGAAGGLKGLSILKSFRT